MCLFQSCLRYKKSPCADHKRQHRAIHLCVGENASGGVGELTPARALSASRNRSEEYRGDQAGIPFGSARSA